jgi:hypothetical protein
VNGTKIGQRTRGEPITATPEPGPRHCLADGDCLRIGEIEFGVGLVTSAI